MLTLLLHVYCHLTKSLFICLIVFNMHQKKICHCHDNQYFYLNIEQIVTYIITSHLTYVQYLCIMLYVTYMQFKSSKKASESIIYENG